MTASEDSTRRHHIGLLCAMMGAILFSTKAIVAKFLYRYGIDAVQLITLRMLFAAPVFVLIAAWKMTCSPALSTSDRWRVVGLGLVGYYLSSMLDFLGLEYISVGLERLLLFLTPTFVLLISALRFSRHIPSRQWYSLCVAYLGIVLVFVHDLHFSGGQVWLGSALVLGAALSYAIYLLGSGEMLARIDSLRLVAYAMCVSTVVCVLQFALLRPWSSLILPMPVYGWSMVNALACTVAPVVLTMFSVSIVGASVASQAGMLGPVSTLVLGAYWLNEPTTVWQLGGCCLVLLGIYLLRKP